MAVKTLFVVLSEPGYATIATLLERFKLKELAELACAGFVPLELFQALLSQTSTGSVNAVAVYEITQVELAREGLRKLCRACKDANSLIDDYLSTALYAVPLENPPDSIINAACDVARYNLWDDGTLENDNVVKIRYREVIERLHDIISGKLVLNLSNAPVSNGIQWTTSTRLFSQDTLKEF
ncbi:MAG: hypothetical protein BWK78_00415 [Thiotrichaceae bacterium IS1]|nr:MAG: hypothetical protein BWK78_00415 [Thiotrichaceae bacterium IS1]